QGGPTWVWGHRYIWTVLMDGQAKVNRAIVQRRPQCQPLAGTEYSCGPYDTPEQSPNRNHRRNETRLLLLPPHEPALFPELPAVFPHDVIAHRALHSPDLATHIVQGT